MAKEEKREREKGLCDARAIEFMKCMKVQTRVEEEKVRKANRNNSLIAEMDSPEARLTRARASSQRPALAYHTPSSETPPHHRAFTRRGNDASLLEFVSLKEVVMLN